MLFMIESNIINDKINIYRYTFMLNKHMRSGALSGLMLDLGLLKIT